MCDVLKYMQGCSSVQTLLFAPLQSYASIPTTGETVERPWIERMARTQRAQGFLQLVEAKDAVSARL